MAVSHDPLAIRKTQIALYAGRLQPTPEAQTSTQKSLVRRQARYLCREIVMLALNDASIPLGERNKLHQALQWLKVTPEAPADVPNMMKEVLAKRQLVVSIQETNVYSCLSL